MAVTREDINTFFHQVDQQHRFNFVLKPQQQVIIEHILNNKDVLGVLPTGRKSKRIRSTLLALQTTKVDHCNYYCCHWCNNVALFAIEVVT